MADNKFRSDRGRDPLAQLARLIAQGDPYAESASDDAYFRTALIHRVQRTPSLGRPLLPLPSHLPMPIALRQ